jgi:hypothetical protein
VYELISLGAMSKIYTSIVHLHLSESEQEKRLQKIILFHEKQVDHEKRQWVDAVFSLGAPNPSNDLSVVYREKSIVAFLKESEFWESLSDDLNGASKHLQEWRRCRTDVFVAVANMIKEKVISADDHLLIVEWMQQRNEAMEMWFRMMKLRRRASVAAAKSSTVGTTTK